MQSSNMILNNALVGALHYNCCVHSGWHILLVCGLFDFPFMFKQQLHILIFFFWGVNNKLRHTYHFEFWLKALSWSHLTTESLPTLQLGHHYAFWQTQVALSHRPFWVMARALDMGDRYSVSTELSRVLRDAVCTGSRWFDVVFACW